MYEDEIITEVWHNRNKYSKQHNDSLENMVADIEIRQQRTECTIVDRREQNLHKTHMDTVSHMARLAG